jgi:hypothetical protein
MNTNWDLSRATLNDARRIANLALTQGGQYWDELWALVEYALDEQVRRFAYAQATGPAAAA